MVGTGVVQSFDDWTEPTSQLDCSAVPLSSFLCRTHLVTDLLSDIAIMTEDSVPYSLITVHFLRHSYQRSQGSVARSDDVTTLTII